MIPTRTLETVAEQVSEVEGARRYMSGVVVGIETERAWTLFVVRQDNPSDRSAAPDQVLKSASGVPSWHPKISETGSKG